MKTIRLITCESPIEANIIKGRLESEGIHCFITNENFSNLMPHYNRILDSGVQVIVSEVDYQKAIDLLELNQEKAILCPHCQSKNISITLGNNWFRKTIVILLSMLFFIPFNNINSTYHCRDCKADFKIR